MKRVLRPAARLVRRVRRPLWLHALGRTEPLSREHGFERGTPVDRYHIEKFVEQHAADITGRVLEFQAPLYTERHGRGVTHADIVDRWAGNTDATIVTDITTDTSIPSDSYDCAVVTQVLLYIFDVQAAVRNLHRVLKPGGVLLVTVPTVSHVMYDVEPHGLGEYNDYWRFTVGSCARLFGDVFGNDHTTVTGYGNVLVGIATLTGMAREELSRGSLDHYDEHYPSLVSVRAVKT